MCGVLEYYPLLLADAQFEVSIPKELSIEVTHGPGCLAGVHKRKPRFTAWPP